MDPLDRYKVKKIIVVREEIENESASSASEVKKIVTTANKGLLLSVLLARSLGQKLQQTQDPH